MDYMVGSSPLLGNNFNNLRNIPNVFSGSSYRHHFLAYSISPAVFADSQTVIDAAHSSLHRTPRAAGIRIEFLYN
jgi:hypothetical protein